MKLLVTIFLALWFTNIYTKELISHFPSQISGISIPNCSYVDSSNRIIRGMSPMDWINELKVLNVTDVLIFKRQVKSEVNQEMEILKKMNIRSSHIPFQWKDISSPTHACVQVIQGLKLIQKVYNSNDRVLYFHCTVGEDRTGLLAGLWDMLVNQKSAKVAFEEQMCRNGYADGNHKKPTKVIKALNQSLTPLFIQLSRLIEMKKISLDFIDESVCNELPKVTLDEILVCSNL